jgi:hypothetical protein
MVEMTVLTEWVVCKYIIERKFANTVKDILFHVCKFPAAVIKSVELRVIIEDARIDAKGAAQILSNELPVGAPPTLSVITVRGDDDKALPDFGIL